MSSKARKRARNGRGHIAGLVLTLAAAGGLLAACGNDDPKAAVDAAASSLAKGDAASAAVRLKAVLQVTPEFGPARLLLGRSQLELREFAAAEKELRRALALGQPPNEVLPLLARAMVMQDQHQQVITEFARQELDDPAADAALRSIVGDSFSMLGNAERAEAAYRAALRRVATFPRARLGLAILKAGEGRVDDALGEVGAIVDANPDMAEARALQAHLLLSKGDRAGARRTLEAAIAADVHLLSIRFQHIGLLIADKEYDAALAALDAAEGVAQRDLRVPFLRSVVALRRGELQSASELAQSVLKSAPDNVPTLVLAGATSMQLGQRAAAERVLRRAITLAPKHADAHRLLATLYLMSGRPAQALDLIGPMVDQGPPEDPQLLAIVGETYLANGDLKNAARMFQLAVERDRSATDLSARTRLGQIAVASGRPDEGLKLLQDVSSSDGTGYRADLAIIATHLQQGAGDKALAAVRVMEKKQPSNPLTFQLFAQAYVAKRDEAAARRNLEKALELQPDYLPAAFMLEQFDTRAGRTDAAVRRYERMIAADPKNVRAILALADLQARSGAEPQAVAATLQQAVLADPESEIARLAQIGYQQRQRDVRSALASAQSAVVALPQSTRLLEALGLAQEATGESNRAVETYNRLATLQPDAVQPLYRLADLQIRQGETDRAVQTIQRAQRVASNPSEQLPRIVRAYMAGQRPTEALKAARELQASQPKQASGFLLAAEIHYGQRRLAEAEKAYREALQREPDSSVIAARLHDFLKASGRTNEADALARKWLADHPRDLAMHLHLAEVDLQARRFPAAIARYRAALVVAPSNPVALNNLAWALGETGSAEALTFAERAAALAPSSASILDTLAGIYAKQGDRAKASTVLERAMKLEPFRHDIRLNHAELLIKMDRKQDARRELELLLLAPKEVPERGRAESLLPGI